MLTDHQLRVRAIRRHARMYDILTAFLFGNAGCRWTAEGRRKRRQFDRLWPRVRDDAAMSAGSTGLIAVLGTFWEHAAKAHVDGCRCECCPRTPKRRRFRKPQPPARRA